MGAEFTSYAFQDLPPKKIKEYAAQYDGVDMIAILGANEENIPFLMKVGDAESAVMIWNAYSGMMAHLDEDSVRSYATVQYLLNNAFPVFESYEAVQQWALSHNWPRKA